MPFNRELYATWRGMLTQIAPDAHPTRLTNMAWLILGIYQARSAQLNLIARTMPVRAKKLSLVKRLSRFLNNGGGRVREWHEAFARPLLQAAASGGQVHLVIDASKVGFGNSVRSKENVTER